MLLYNLMTGMMALPTLLALAIPLFIHGRGNFSGISSKTMICWTPMLPSIQRQETSVSLISKLSDTAREDKGAVSIIFFHPVVFVTVFLLQTYGRIQALLALIMFHYLYGCVFASKLPAKPLLLPVLLSRPPVKMSLTLILLATPQTKTFMPMVSFQYLTIG